MGDKIKISKLCQYGLLNPTKTIDISGKTAIISLVNGKDAGTEIIIPSEFAALLRNSMTYPYSSGTLRTLANVNEKICIEVLSLSKGFGGGRRTKRAKRTKRSKRTRRAKRRA